MSRFVKSFGLFWYDFIVGDDWTIAAGIVAATLASAWLVREGVNAWWLLPLVSVVMLARSLFREAKRPRQTGFSHDA